MIRRIISLLLLLAVINAQIALPTFQGVQKLQNIAGTPENPLQSSGLSPDMVNIGWVYLLGFTFTPQVNGTITQLGGYYNGTKTVYLWKVSDGSFLGSVSNTSSNNWAYTDLGSSVSVTSGTEYYVGVAINGSGGARFRFISDNLPNTYGNITINRSYYKSGNFNSTTMPTSWSGSHAGYTWGVADITFVPN